MNVIIFLRIIMDEKEMIDNYVMLIERICLYNFNIYCLTKIIIIIERSS